MVLDLNCMTNRIIGAAIKVHKALGPGLLESAYETCLNHELKEAGFKLERQKPQPVIYEGITINCGYRMDLVVENSVVLELKAVEKVLPIHKAQLLSYLRLSGCKVGLLINFNTKYLKEGISRIVNNF